MFKKAELVNVFETSNEGFCDYVNVMNTHINFYPGHPKTYELIDIFFNGLLQRLYKGGNTIIPVVYTDRINSTSVLNLFEVVVQDPEPEIPNHLRVYLMADIKNEYSIGEVLEVMPLDIEEPTDFLVSNK